MREPLKLCLAEDVYRHIVARYHFRETDEKQLCGLAEELIRVAAPALYCAPCGLEKESRLAVLVTLGAGVDDLQDSYLTRERLTEGYMIECIAMELLQNAYEQAAEKIYSRYGRWISGFDFVGEAVPIEQMEELLRLLEPEEISCNQAYMLSPKKSAAFYTTLTDKRQSACCDVCESCGNISCAYRKRNLTYGYQRIFG